MHMYAMLKYVQSFMSKSEFRSFFLLAAAAAAGFVFLTVIGLTWAGVYQELSLALEIFDRGIKLRLKS